MSSSELENFIAKVRADIEVDTIGKSVLGKNLYSFVKRSGENLPWALVVGGMHAREHLSSDIVCKFIEKSINKNLSYNLCFVPLASPDGADLCINGADGLDEKTKNKLIAINGGEDFSLYKANANGVDLNNNWEANWDRKFTNKTSPSSQGFYGDKPMSEPEVIALANLTKQLNPFLAISYHLKGEEIYFDFFQDEKRYLRDKLIARAFAKSSGYSIKSTQNISSGGYKDWCVQKLRISALTIELGSDDYSHPYPKLQLDNIYKKNKDFFKNIEKSLKIYKNFS